MTTQNGSSRTSRPSAALYAAKLASGPVLFMIALYLPLGLDYRGRIAFATFACAVAWWISRPMPWAIASVLPLLVFPATGVMTIGAISALYGHPILFWIMGTVLVGYAIEKHGAAQRFALAFLSFPGIGGNTYRLTFAYMAVTGGISAFVSDAATIAMMIPIGMSVVRHIRTIVGAREGTHTNFGAFMTLATFYAAVAGGTATMVGIPHNAISVSLLEEFTGRSLGWFEWMAFGVPVFLGLLVCFYVLLWVIVPPEIRTIPGGEEFLRAERAKLGRITSNEWRVVFVFGAMVLLFILPTLAELALGPDHAVTAAVGRALPIWVVPPAILFLLFTIPASEGGGSTLLGWKEAEAQTPWNVIILVLGAIAMTAALTQFGFVDLMGQLVSGMGLSSTSLPYVAAALSAVTTNFISGTAATTLFCSIFIPASVEAGYSPASMAILISNVGLGIALPWAGAASATAFAVGEIEMARMIRIGAIATLTFIFVVATIHLLLSGLI